jgi:hypothetical protein
MKQSRRCRKKGFWFESARQTRSQILTQLCAFKRIEEAAMLRKQTLAASFGLFTLGFLGMQAQAQQPQAPQPAPHVKTEAVIMLQNDALMNKRVPSIGEMGRYLKAVREAFAQAYEPVKTPETLNAIVAVKPGKKARLWLVSSLQNPPDRADLMTRFQTVPVPEVKEGLVAFAIRFTIAGATPEKIPMFPPEWMAAFGGQPAMMPDAITAYIWKD